MAATESSLSPVVESVVPASMFAPDPGCAEDSPGAELSDAGDNQNGEAEDHLDITSKVALGPMRSFWTLLYAHEPLQEFIW